MMNDRQLKMFQCIISLLLLSWAQTGAVVPYSPLQDSLSGTNELYTSSSTSITVGTTQEYIVSYGTTMVSTPEVIFSISAYRDLSDFSSSFVRTSYDASASPLASFKIFLLLGGSASVTRLVISYMALIDTASAIYIITNELNTLPNLNTGSGPRTESKSTNFLIVSGGNSLNSNLAKNMGIPFIVGYDMAISSQFVLDVSLAITSATALSTTVSTNYDCYVNMVKLRYLLINTGLWDSANPAIIATYTEFQGSNQNVTVTNFGSVTTKMMGVMGFQGTINNDFFFNYIQQDGDTVTFDNSNEITDLTYGFILIGQAGCPDTYPYFEDNTQAYCVDQCPSSHTQTPTSNICEACDAACAVCGNIPSECTSCPTGYALNGTTCQVVDSPAASSKTQEKSSDVGTSMLPLLGFLGVIPVAGGIVYYLLRRRNFRTIACSDRIQPEISL